MPDSDRFAPLHQYGFMKNLSQRQHLRNVFFAIFIAAQVTGLLMVASIVIWAVNGNSAEQAVTKGDKTGGIGPFLSFYYHPVFMTIGMVFLTGQGAILFRVLRNVDRNILKIPHLLVMSTVTVLTVMGTYAIFVAQANVTPMRALHDWIGLLTIILFGVQLVFGFLAKFYPGASPPLAQWYRPVHNSMGMIIFVLACAAVLTGIALDGEPLKVVLPPGWMMQYHFLLTSTAAIPLLQIVRKDFSTNGSISKAVGMFTVGFAICVVVLVANRDFARTDSTTSNKSEERSRLLADAASTSNHRGYNAIE